MDEIEKMIPWSDEFAAWVLAVEQDQNYQLELRNQLTSNKNDAILDL